MEFAVVTFAKFGIVAFGQDDALGGRQLVMRRNHAALPFHVAGPEGLGHRVVFEQDSELGKLSKILDRYRCNLEAALALGNDKSLRRQSVQNLAQRTDADAVVLFHRVELEAPGRRQDTENNVGADALIAAVAGRHGCLGMFQNRQGLDPALRFAMARRSRLAAASISANAGLMTSYKPSFISNYLIYF